jgi:hypothetical protein
MADEMGDLDATEVAEMVVTTDDIDDPDNASAGDDASDDMGADNDGDDGADTGDDDSTDDSDDDQGDDGEFDADSLRKEIESGYKDAIKDLKAELADLKKENNRIGYALRKAEKGAGKEKDAEEGDAQFTDAQLLQMMEEHGDNKKVLFQIMKEMVSQNGKAIEQSAEAKATVRARSKELDDVVNQVHPGAFDEGSETYKNIQTTKAYLGLESNPYGDHLSLAMMAFKNIPNLVSAIKEQTRKELLGKTADEKRKTNIKSQTPADKGKKKTKTVPLPPGATEAAERLGFSKNPTLLKRYQAILNADKGNKGEEMAATQRKTNQKTPTVTDDVLTQEQKSIRERVEAQETDWFTISEESMHDFSLAVNPMDLDPNFPMAAKLQKEKKYVFRFCERTPERIDELTRSVNPPLRWAIVNRQTLPELADKVDPVLGCVCCLDQVLLFKPFAHNEMVKRAKQDLAEARSRSPQDKLQHEKVEVNSGPRYKISGGDQVTYEDTRDDASLLGDLVIDE